MQSKRHGFFSAVDENYFNTLTLDKSMVNDAKSFRGQA
jgi:hypothetical protein